MLRTIVNVIDNRQLFGLRGEYKDTNVAIILMVGT